uniref:C2H2-type domain-containing protein n=1 Tax=Sinocyclocheilus rhinocerous TaxID=307959 RepID=A0A673FNE6_9TELE
MSSSSGSGSSASGYPQFLRTFHPAEAALAQEQLHSGMGRFDFAGGSTGGGSGVIGGVVTSAPPPPPLHPGLSVPQPSPGPSSSSPSPSSSTTTSNNTPSSSSSVAGLVGAQSDARSFLRRHIRCHEEDGGGPNSSTNTNPSHQHQSDHPHSTQDGISQNAHHQHENTDPMSSACSSPNKSYCCNECGKGFKKRGHLLQHGVIHSGARPYACSVCDRRETLRRHERVHTGEKPFHCDICGKDFREPFHLTKHQTVHSGEKNYKCTLCGKDFGYAQSLKRHEKLHLRGDFKPRRSKTKSDKVQGSNASTSNQPPPKLYTCEICWKSFRHHFHLTAHHQAIHEHGGEKLFSCEVCGKAFSYSNSLTRHRLSQHGLTRTGTIHYRHGSLTRFLQRGRIF